MFHQNKDLSVREYFSLILSSKMICFLSPLFKKLYNLKAFSEEALSSIILLLYLNPQCFAVLLDFFVEASYELVSVQVPETYVVSPSKIGKDLFQFGGTEHRRRFRLCTG